MTIGIGICSGPSGEKYLARDLFCECAVAILAANELKQKNLDPNNLALSCTIDGEVRQNSRTNDLIFGINHCVWYISQFMELKAGDVINTGTPEGVGMGFKPEKYLKGGENIVTTIEGIGTIKNKVVNYK